MFKTINKNNTYYMDISFLSYEDLYFLQEHGFPKDFKQYKDRKYLFSFPLVKNGKFSSLSAYYSAKTFEDVVNCVEYLKYDEKQKLKFSKENGIEKYPLYAKSAYKRGYRLGNTVWILENPDYKEKR